MSESNTCPKCGAEVSSINVDCSGVWVWTCGTQATWKDGVFVQWVESSTCLRRQLASAGMALDKALSETSAMTERAEKAEAFSDIDEFNAGFDAAKAGLPYDEPSGTTRDCWRIGYAWFHWPTLRAASDQWKERAEKAESELQKTMPMLCLDMKADRDRMAEENERLRTAINGLVSGLTAIECWSENEQLIPLVEEANAAYEQTGTDGK